MLDMTENLFGSSHDLTCWTSQQLFKVSIYNRFPPNGQCHILISLYLKFWVILLNITMKITKMLEAQEYVLGREKEKQRYAHILEWLKLAGT